MGYFFLHYWTYYSQKLEFLIFTTTVLLFFLISYLNFWPRFFCKHFSELQFWRLLRTCTLLVLQTSQNRSRFFSPVHLVLDLESLHLILLLYFFFKNAKNTHASGGLILSLGKFGLIPYLINSELVFLTTVRAPL